MQALSSWSIKNPVPTLVLFLALTLSGLTGFAGLRTNNMPDIDLPSVKVTVTQPGAAPSQLETQVTRIVEDALAGISNVEHITSTVGEGTSTTTVQFVIDVNIDRATNDVRNAVSSIQAKLPASAQLPVIQRVEAPGAAILTFAVAAPMRSPQEVSWFIDNDVAKRLLAIRGVAKIQRAGGVDRAVRLHVDPDRLAALGVTASRLSQALATVNVDQPGGRMMVGSREQTVRTVGSARSIAELGDLAVPLTNGTAVRLCELGRIEDGVAEIRQRARLNGEETVAFSVYLATGSSEVDVTQAVRQAVKAMNASGSVTLREVTSSTAFVQEAYEASLETLWIGALLAVGIVWLFLRDLRATLVSSVALPLSLIPTFGIMRWFDVSLNTITLLALSLVVGILVDDAIVEIENIVRHMRQTGRSAYQAAIEAADEIGLAVVATTATIIAVFLPVAFMPGIPGRIFTSFAIATCVSVAFSLAVARMLTPLLGAHLLRSGGHEVEPRWMPAYLAVLSAAMRYRRTTVALGFAFFAASLLLATRLPSDFIVATDRSRAVASVTLPPGATLDETDRIVLAITRILAAHPEVTDVYATEGAEVQSGIGASSTPGQVNIASVTANLTPRSSRSLSQQQLERDFAREFASIPGARIQFGADGQSGSKIKLTLVGDVETSLRTAEGALLADLRKVPGLANPTATSSLTKPEIVILPDSVRVAELGIGVSGIADAVKVATLGDNEQALPKFDLSNRRLSIIVALDEVARGDLSKIASLPVTAGPNAVPLGAVATMSFTGGPSEIERFDRSRSLSVEAELHGLTLGQAQAAISTLPSMQRLPAGVANAATGDVERLSEMMRGFAMAITAGIILMYFTLVLLFGGFIQPLTILVALPLSLGGALGLLYLTGHALSVTALIGLLMLMGLAAKNSILLVDYAIVVMKERGLACRDAVLEAATKRARPIIMTSLAMGGGMLPIAAGFGADAESRAPMAVAVIGGLLSSTALSLVYVPVVFTLVDGVGKSMSHRLRRRSTM